MLNLFSNQHLGHIHSKSEDDVSDSSWRELTSSSWDSQDPSFFLYTP